ncbi:FRG domain-containing protein [Enterococcus sp. AZ177]|uniref:FRG domain-containing protein n=1 Tax=unclassified Enterococcus TaxID=2608891 RepID=UPI003D300C81
MEELIFDHQEEEEEGEDDRIETLSDFIRFIENLPTGFVLSRGQAGDYPLLPGALRVNKGVRKFSKSDILYFQEEFQTNSHNYMSNSLDSMKKTEWMIYAQHYGIPTKLLDFTYSHIISLMFAVENAFEDKEDLDAQVWFLNPEKLNLHSCKSSKIINISESDDNIEDYAGPVVIKSRKLNERINSQNGLFVYFQEGAEPLEEYAEEKMLRKVIINGAYKKKILSSLYDIGITFTSLYPELPYLCKDIIMRSNLKNEPREE